MTFAFGMIPATRAPPCADRSISRALAHYARSRTPARLIAGNWYQNDPLSVFRASRREAEKANGKLFSRKIRRKKISYNKSMFSEFRPSLIRFSWASLSSWFLCFCSVLSV